MYGSVGGKEKHPQPDGLGSSEVSINLKLGLSVILAGAAVVLVLVFGSAPIAGPPDLQQQQQQQLLALSHPSSSLSSRGQGIKSVRNDLAMFQAGAADPFHPTHNKEGYLVMLVAENRLMWNEMANRLLQSSASPLPQWIFDYGDMGGRLQFKQSMAKMMQKWIPSHIDPDKLWFQAGAGSILDQLSYCLGDVNDAVLVTAPNYSAFTSDFGFHGRLVLYVAPSEASNGYVPTVVQLNDCFQRAVAAGNPPKIFVICQPNNPTGIVYSRETMHLMISWALDKGLHVISDEIYALSVFPGTKTISAAQIMAERNLNEEHYLGDRVHIVAGLSKDWGMSGFRVGSLFTHNAQLLQAIDTAGYYESVSQYTQNVLTSVFDDNEWIDWYIAENQNRLFETFSALEEALSLVNVPLVVSPHGSLFAWADFSSFLKEGQSEKDLWLELFEGPRVLFTTGESCHGEKPGLFRIVYSWPEGGPEAMRELGDRLVKWKTERGS